MVKNEDHPKFSMSLTAPVIEGMVTKFLAATRSATVKFQAGPAPGLKIGNEL